MKHMAFVGVVLGMMLAAAGVVVLSLPWTYPDRFKESIDASDFAVRWLAFGLICLIGGGLAAMKNLHWYTTVR